MKKNLPDKDGYFGRYGGKYVPETLIAPLDELESAYKKAQRDRKFRSELDAIYRDYVGRPTPISAAPRFAQKCGKFQLFLKREDLAHTGAHKINNAVGQALLAKRMARKDHRRDRRGQHGVATATACAFLGLKCVVYMGEVDMARQEMNVFACGSWGPKSSRCQWEQDVKDAINEASVTVTTWRTRTTSSARSWPHPYPQIVRDFQSSSDAKHGPDEKETGGLPAIAVACWRRINARTLLEMLPEKKVRLIVSKRAAGLSAGRTCCAVRMAEDGRAPRHSLVVLQDEWGQIGETHLCPLDRLPVGWPEHAFYAEAKRIEFFRSRMIGVGSVSPAQ